MSSRSGRQPASSGLIRRTFVSDDVGIKPKGNKIPPITEGYEATKVVVAVGQKRSSGSSSFKVGDTSRFLPSDNV
ncbi:uncharacterized protein SPSK_02071 [Sporothrix schenckii 1099-18]|uniref:Uncharacterized protein n=1 Tax=Sporothrix schenckii 1099-18 TaxID=1397361 RepID=A0A0F2MFH7_SPOSC|nr:uncharacterized protein SPSK_02071 [Sporothrix schenckii 1099-18]KJR87590.1 hypothetical protein SPSK_02071 [Sporothrix schenckii 1099-18]